jgi:hypothetical protein
VGDALRREPRSDVAMDVTSRVRSAHIVDRPALRVARAGSAHRVTTLTPRLPEVGPMGTSTG